ncbi:hypothetical protein [Moorena sp. SIO4G3]|nr:hypothetical protein [Moorena sp. SIO4G3]NEO80035.1 hypothetical protein [Moorena sp. SIO4G3]
MFPVPCSLFPVPFYYSLLPTPFLEQKRDIDVGWAVQKINNSSWRSH